MTTKQHAAKTARGARPIQPNASNTAAVESRSKQLAKANPVTAEPVQLVLDPSKATLPPAHVIREISVKSKRDPRSVERYLRGQPVRPSVAAAVRDALRDLGIEHEEARVA